MFKKKSQKRKEEKSRRKKNSNLKNVKEKNYRYGILAFLTYAIGIILLATLFKIQVIFSHYHLSFFIYIHTSKYIIYNLFFPSFLFFFIF